eukprot:Gb_05289 [translate_table: standard]
MGRPDTRHIFVDIGLGFHVEFTWSEALQYISMKEKALSRFDHTNWYLLSGFMFLFFAPWTSNFLSVIPIAWSTTHTTLLLYLQNAYHIVLPSAFLLDVFQFLSQILLGVRLADFSIQIASGIHCGVH